MEQVVDYYYCGSYQILFIALHAKLKKHDIVIITPKPDIQKISDRLNIECHSINEFSYTDIVKKKKKVDNQISNLIQLIGQGTLHFSHTQFDVFCFLLVNRYIRSSQKVIYHKLEFEYPLCKFQYFNIGYYRMLFFKHAINIMYKQNIVIKEFSKKPVLGITKKFIEKQNIKIENDEAGLSDYVQDIIPHYQINYEGIRNLYLIQDTNSLPVKIDSEKVEKVNEFLEKKKVHYKPHPNSNRDMKFSENRAIPSYIPAELLYKSVKISVISISSGALFVASRFKNLKAISLVDLVGIQNKEYIDKIKNYLNNNSTNKIYYPKNLDELEKLI